MENKTDAELYEKIIKEYKRIDDKKIKSVLDEIEDQKDKDKEKVSGLIKNYKDKIDLVDQFLELIPLHYDKSGMWWRWFKHRWVLIDEVDVLNLINDSSGANIIQSKERTEILNALKQKSRKRKPKQPKKTWIQFNDEIVDLKTGERFEANPDYFVTNPIPYDIGSKKETPIMDKIFKEWVGEEYVKTLYEIIAYCLLPDYPLHRMFCLIGAGMNGKSKFLNLLRKFIGIDNVCATELDLLLKSRFEVTRLHKKLVCLMGETNFNNMSKTSTLKKLTGGDLIGFEYKNKNPFEEPNYAKIIIATNSLPTTDDKTLGFYRRWLILDFPNQFSESKDILEEIPEEEYENLGCKCIGLLIELLDKREFHNEGDVLDKMEKYESKSDFLGKFLKDYTEEDLESYISKNEFYKKFIEWCVENKHRKLAENTLGKKMKELKISDGRKYADWLHDGKGGQFNVWLGIKWKQ